MIRRELEQRQQVVLRALLRGDLPEGFDPRSAEMTSRVLRNKRRSEALGVAPALTSVPRLAARFDAWAARHPRRGCAHDDVVDFVAAADDPLPEPFASVRAVERVYRGRATCGRDRRPGHRTWVVAVAGHVWHVGPRAPR